MVVLIIVPSTDCMHRTKRAVFFLGLLKPSLHENLIGTRSTEIYCTIQATTPKFALRTIRSCSARLSAVDHSLSGSKSQLAASSPPSPHCSLALALWLTDHEQHSTRAKLFVCPCPAARLFHPRTTYKSNPHRAERITLTVGSFSVSVKIENLTGGVLTSKTNPPSYDT
jgi:hypothetical protein